MFKYDKWFNAIMSGLDTLNKRLEYLGGQKQENRMQADKLKSLKKAMLYSYQAATAILLDKREFRCLINPDKLKNDYEDKILSIPFEDICLNNSKKGKTSQGIETIGLECGDVFKWKEDDSYWIIYLRNSEEKAYFRAEIRKCRYEVKIDNEVYHVYVRGPEKETMTWHSRNTNPRTSWNDIDYDLLMYVTNNEKTKKFFHRFQKIDIDGRPWEVQAVDNISTIGIIEVALKETYQNSLEKKENKKEENPQASYIKGDLVVYPFDEKEYTIEGFSGGTWKINNTKAKILSCSDTAAKVSITTGKTGSFVISYIKDDEEIASLTVTIDSI